MKDPVDDEMDRIDRSLFLKMLASMVVFVITASVMTVSLFRFFR